MKFLTKDQESLILEIDSNVKNKFRLDWLDRKVTVKVKIGSKFDEVTEALGQFLKKPDVAGKAYCVYCSDLINYGSRGCVALTDHATKVKKHADKIAIRRSNYSLGSAFFKQTSSADTTKDVTRWGTLAEPSNEICSTDAPRR